MRRLFVALTACVALCAPLLPATARAAGRPAMQRPLQAVGAAPIRGGFLAQPIFEPKSAFGSPGGFPLALPGSPEQRFARVRPARFPHRVPAHVVPRFPVTTVYYASPAFYEPAFESVPQPVSVAPVVYVSPTVYVSPPAVSSPPVVAPPAAPPLPSVVEHPTGRYELRGDGVATPYVWVWIPNPPPAPPAASSPAPEEPRAKSTSSAGRSQIYRWTDDEGTTIWTNRMESIPESQRPRAQKLGQAAVQP